MDSVYKFPKEAHFYVKANHNFRCKFNKKEKDIINWFLWKLADPVFSYSIVESPKYNKKSYVIQTKLNHAASVHILSVGYFRLEIIIHEHGKKFDVVNIERVKPSLAGSGQSQLPNENRSKIVEN